MTVYSSAIAGRGAARQPVWATQLWGCDFGGSITLGAIANDGAGNGVNFYKPITGVDGNGYNLTTNVETAFACAGKSYDVTTSMILTGNNLALSNVATYADSTIQKVPGPLVIGRSVNSYKNNIKDRYTQPGAAGGHPQMHLLIRRGRNEATQPTLITKQYIEFYFKLPANLLTMLSHVPPDAGPNAANWAEIFELKRGFQYFRLGNYYYYGVGDYRFKIEVLQIAGNLLLNVGGDNVANCQLGSFDGSITNNILTVTSMASGTILNNAKLIKTGITTGTKIVNQLTKTETYWGGMGTYTVDTDHGAGTGPLTGISSCDPSSLTPGANVTFWNYTSPCTPLDTWTRCQIYFECPADRTDLTAGRTWVAVTPDGGSRVILCDQIGQDSGKYQVGFNGNPQARYYFAADYSGGGHQGAATGNPAGEAITNEICNIKVYDSYPYAPSTMS